MKKHILLLLFLCLDYTACYGQTVVGDKFDYLNLTGKLKILTDSTNHLSCMEVLQIRHKFADIPHKEPSIRFNINKKNNWVIFDVTNKSNKPVVSYLKNSHPFTDYYSVYAIRNGVIVDSAHSEYERKLKINFDNSGRVPVFKHSLAPNSTTTFMLKVRNEAGSLVHTYDFYDTDSFLQDHNISQLIYTIFFGIGLTLFLMAMAFFFISKSSLYLYYAFYVILVNLGFQGIVGNLNYLFEPKIDFLLGDSSFRFYVPLSLIFNVLFLNRFFEIEPHHVWYRRFSVLTITLASITIILTVLDLGYLYYKLNRIIAAEPLFVAFVVFTFIFNFKRKPEAFKLYTFSFLPISLLLFWRILVSLGLLPQPTYFAVYFIIGLVFEILVLLIGLSYNFLEKIYAQKKLEKDIIIKQIETQEEERKRIAQDLHDDLGATLVMLKHRSYADDAAPETLVLINKAIQDLRNISRNLLPSEFETFGLINSIKKNIDNLNKQQDIKFTFINCGDYIALKQDVELNIYRIITELSNNILKHSEAQHAEIQLIYHEEYLCVSVEDDGKGLIITENNVGIGLKNVFSRIEYLQAKILEVGTSSCCSFIFEIPFKPHKI